MPSLETAKLGPKRFSIARDIIERRSVIRSGAFGSGSGTGLPKRSNLSAAESRYLLFGNSRTIRAKYLAASSVFSSSSSDRPKYHKFTSISLKLGYFSTISRQRDWVAFQALRRSK